MLFRGTSGVVFGLFLSRAPIATDARRSLQPADFAGFIRAHPASSGLIRFSRFFCPVTAVAEVLAEAGPEHCTRPGGPVEERLNELARTADDLAQALHRADSVRRIPWPAAVARHVATARKLACELADALGEPGA